MQLSTLMHFLLVCVHFEVILWTSIDASELESSKQESEALLLMISVLYIIQMLRALKSILQIFLPLFPQVKSLLRVSKLNKQIIKAIRSEVHAISFRKSKQSQKTIRLFMSPKFLKSPQTLPFHPPSNFKTMNKPPSPQVIARKPQRPLSSFSFYSRKLSIYLLVTCVPLFILFQVQSLQTPLSPPPYSSWTFMQNLINTNPTFKNCTTKIDFINSKLQESVTFLPLKDLRYAHAAEEGHTWFMSSMYDTHEEGEVQYQEFPSKSSRGRILCIKGHNNHDGSWNSYALAWPEALPRNATLMKGLTFISNNHYNYDNLWHGLSAMVPFVAWHIKNECATPSRWILYHWGELRYKTGSWLQNLMEATYSKTLNIEGFDGFADDEPVCFEKAVVMRHNEGGMSREKRMQVYDLLRCKARIRCNVSLGSSSEGRIGMTIFMRTGARSFRNESEVVRIFDGECRKVEGCQTIVAYSNNLTFCEQVHLMSSTDILISPHGAQLTNLFFMNRNSSIMEFFPKGWLKLAGVGQFVFHWMASWSGMNHKGVWRDPDGDHCPYSDNDRRCMSIYKSGKIGHNETYFAEWARNVLKEVKIKKTEEASARKLSSNSVCECS